MHGVELYQEGVKARSLTTTSVPWTYQTSSTLFPESCSRGEHWVPPRPQHAEETVAPSNSTPTLSTTVVKYVREIREGVLEDGRITASHPFVARYLDALIVDYAYKTEHTGGGPSSCRQYQEDNGDLSVGCPEDVGLLIGEELTDLECDAIFTLAALDIMDKISHRAHLAVWNRAARDRTAATVDRMWRHNPRPIYHEPAVWCGFYTSIWRLSCRQNFEIQKCTLNDPDPKARRKKEAGARTRSAAARAKRGNKATSVPRADKGKAVGRSGPATAAPRIPKPRTARAKASASAEPAVPTRRSQRRTATKKKSPLRESTTAEELAALQAKVERAASPALATPAPERDPNDAEVDVEMPKQPSKAAAPRAKRARTSTSAPSRVSMRVAARTPAPAPVPTPTPQLEGSATPEVASPVDSLQPSRSSTAVASGEEPDKIIVVEQMPLKAAGKKRKVDERDQAEPDPPEQGEAEPPRKSRRTATRRLTEKGEALDAEMKAERAVKRSRARRR
ncbi:hypothetical protein DAEQUDRAFT_758303 [Daedalea quercina L-15889]|uniref:Uncharacterized protein n=1 Tax=Daedalea quercina L-15889 TaxID=1314783 RepID=A0A165NMF6_9APHY|nr:hypothetical protein DAEQUDRAFT_758303 [Daedalea quercina L-15889]